MDEVVDVGPDNGEGLAVLQRDQRRHKVDVLRPVHRHCVLVKLKLDYISNKRGDSNARMCTDRLAPKRRTKNNEV